MSSEVQIKEVQCINGRLRLEVSGETVSGLGISDAFYFGLVGSRNLVHHFRDPVIMKIHNETWTVILDKQENADVNDIIYELRHQLTNYPVKGMP